jgi:hypothetical protein
MMLLVDAKHPTDIEFSMVLCANKTPTPQEMTDTSKSRKKTGPIVSPQTLFSGLLLHNICFQGHSARQFFFLLANTTSAVLACGSLVQPLVSIT